MTTGRTIGVEVVDLDLHIHTGIGFGLAVIERLEDSRFTRVISEDSVYDLAAAEKVARAAAEVVGARWVPPRCSAHEDICGARCITDTACPECEDESSWAQPCEDCIRAESA